MRGTRKGMRLCRLAVTAMGMLLSAPPSTSGMKVGGAPIFFGVSQGLPSLQRECSPLDSRFKKRQSQSRGSTSARSPLWATTTVEREESGSSPVKRSRDSAPGKSDDMVDRGTQGGSGKEIAEPGADMVVAAGWRGKILSLGLSARDAMLFWLGEARRLIPAMVLVWLVINTMYISSLFFLACSSSQVPWEPSNWGKALKFAR